MNKVKKKAQVNCHNYKVNKVFLKVYLLICCLPIFTSLYPYLDYLEM